MLPMGYGGIDRIYGDISMETADIILDLVDEYIDLREAVEGYSSDEECNRST